MVSAVLLSLLFAVVAAERLVPAAVVAAFAVVAG